jgi:hypothetical protein
MSHLPAIVVDILCYGAIAFVLAFGINWARRSPKQDTSLVFAIASFSLVTGSVAIAISSMLYARKIGGFPHYDPMLMRILRWGFCLSLAAVIIAYKGVPRRSTNRWLLLTLSIGMMMFWLLTMLEE